MFPCCLSRARKRRAVRRTGVASTWKSAPTAIAVRNESCHLINRQKPWLLHFSLSRLNAPSPYGSCARSGSSRRPR
jgi:hypothetical protein